MQAQLSQPYTNHHHAVAWLPVQLAHLYALGSVNKKALPSQCALLYQRDEEEAAPKKYTQATGKPTKKVVVDLPVGFEPEIKRKPRRRNKKSAAGQVSLTHSAC